MQYGTSQFLLLLISVPVLVAVVCLAAHLRRRALNVFVHAELRELMTSDHSPRRVVIKACCIFCALILIIIALSRPQWGREEVEVRRKGIDLMFVLDTSLSMLAEDIAPNRFEKAKLEILSFASQMKGNRIGLVMFAGASYLICPLTIDHGAFRLFLKTQKVGAVGEQGTALSQAIDTAFRAMQMSKTKSKAVVILTDGEDHEGYIDAIITKSKKNKIPLYCIGMGRKDGAPIPIKDENKNILGYKKEASGQVVMSTLHDTLLLRLAKETGGLYFPSTAGEGEVDTIVRHLETFEKTQFDAKFFTQKEEKYHVFLYIAFVLLMVEVAIGRHRKIRQRKRAVPVLLLVCFLMLSTAAAPSLSQDMISGNAAYHDKDFSRAIECYKQATVKFPDSADAFYNLGNAYYSSQKFDDAEKSYKKALALCPEKATQMGDIMYNLANTMYRLKRNDDALKLYKNVLQVRENDEDAKFNIEYLTKNNKPLDNKNSEPKKKKDQQQQQQKNDQQKQDGQGQEKKNDSSGGDSDQKKDDSQGTDGQDTSQNDKDQQKKQQDPQNAQNKDQADNSDEAQEKNQQQQSSQQETKNPEGDKPQEGNRDGSAEQPANQPPQEIDRTNEQAEQTEQDDAEQQNVPRPDEQKSEEQIDEPGNEQQQEREEASEEEAMRVLRALQESEENAGMVHFTAPRDRRQETKGKDW